ncbi:unnamed protein product, partial [marine sediment metagenome]
VLIFDYKILYNGLIENFKNNLILLRLYLQNYRFLILTFYDALKQR